MCEDCPSLCGRLIDLGASAKGEGYQITPLQIAAYNLDAEAVKFLPDFGADPNGIGNPEGIQWGERNILHRYNVLAGKSSLECCLRVKNEYAAKLPFSDDRIEIADLFHKYGVLCLSSERSGSEDEDGGCVDEEEEEEEGYEDEEEDEDEEIQDELGPSGGD